LPLTHYKKKCTMDDMFERAKELLFDAFVHRYDCKE